MSNDPKPVADRLEFKQKISLMEASRKEHMEGYVLDTNSELCPNCGKANLYAADPCYSTGEISIYMACNHCHAGWTAIYVLSRAEVELTGDA